MPGSNICRLCRNSCDNSIRLTDVEGKPNEIYNITIKYFHPTFLKEGQRATSEISVLCTECWNHISSFNSFQQTVMLIQANLLEEFEHAHAGIEKETDIIQSQDTMEIAGFTVTTSNSNVDNDSANITAQTDIQIPMGFGSGKLVVTASTIELSTNLDDIAENIPSGHSQQFVANPESHGIDEKNETSIVIDSDESDREMPYMIESSNSSNDLSIKGSNDPKNSKTNSDFYSTGKKANNTIAKWKPFLNCYVCSEKFPSFGDVELHMRNKHPYDEFYIQCCRQKFKFLYNLEEHALSHVDSKAFLCRECGKNFKRKSQLLGHIYLSHEKGKHIPMRSKGTPSSKNTCVECQIVFCYKGGLYHHNKIHHPDVFANRTRRSARQTKDPLP
ncbi:uncharacterized protein LOC142231709 [Haematobia irritans]|uniref:uncharacterized protein LOC142231709 n=1 Tax=Haematobia irritans TaxID=7368 RepID=UPI003F4FE10C